MDEPIHKDITISLLNIDGNAFYILAACRQAMRKNGVYSDWEIFQQEAMSGDYDHLLRTVMKWFNTE